MVPNKQHPTYKKDMFATLVPNKQHPPYQKDMFATLPRSIEHGAIETTSDIQQIHVCDISKLYARFLVPKEATSDIQKTYVCDTDKIHR